MSRLGRPSLAALAIAITFGASGHAASPTPTQKAAPGTGPTMPPVTLTFKCPTVQIQLTGQALSPNTDGWVSVVSPVTFSDNSDRQTVDSSMKCWYPRAFGFALRRSPPATHPKCSVESPGFVCRKH